MRLFFLLSLSFIIISGCSSSKIVSSKVLNRLSNDASQWNLDQCYKVINFYTADNTGGEIFKSGLSGQKVYIKVLPLNINTLKALSRKEVIEKRLDSEEYYGILNNYLDSFLNSKYDTALGRVVDTAENYTKGYSFKVFFENISNPYEPIFLEEGYSYFFLENMNGEFSRVTEVSGLYVEEYFQLDGYLNAVITFSPFSADGKRLFKAKQLNESYKLVFNGLQKQSVVISWNIN